MTEFFEIGLITNTHALKGEVKVKPYTESPKKFASFPKVWIEIEGHLVIYEVESVRVQQEWVLLKLKTVDTVEEAEKLKNHLIKIPRTAAKQLEENEYFIADLIGCEVYDQEFLGIVDDIFTAGAGDVYVVKRKNKKDLLLPALKSVIQKIDVEHRRIDVKIPRGLEDEI